MANFVSEDQIEQAQLQRLQRLCGYDALNCFAAASVDLKRVQAAQTDAMTQDETQRVKLAAQRLLKRLVEEHPKMLVQDWFKDDQTQKQVRSEIERVLDEGLPDSYGRALFKQKCDNVFDWVVDCASRGRKWAA